MKNEIKRYDPAKHLRAICENVSECDARMLRKDIAAFCVQGEKYVFSDVIKFLDHFQKNQLFIVSFSKTAFQKEKIRSSGLRDRFRRVVVTDGKKADEIKKILQKSNRKIQEKICFLDDRLEHIESVKKAIPAITTFLVKRKSGRYFDQKTNLCDYEVGSLAEAWRVISKLT